MGQKRVALITGGSRGIGLGIAQQLAKIGFAIAINGMRPENEVADVIEDLRAHSVAVIYCQGNIGDGMDRVKIIEKVKKTFGQLNVLVNNAGVAPKERKDVLEMTEESFDRVLDINLKGSFFLTQLAANWMVEQKQAFPEFEGSIIMISSVSAEMVSINRGEYCISKAGLGMVTQLFAVRLGDFNIPVYEVRPGIIKTDMTAGVQEKYDRLFAEGIAVQKRWGLSEDVGRAVAALAKGDFPYSTGQVIMVDGGLSIPRL